MIVSAQPVEGLAESPQERNRLLGAMGGGVLVGRTTNAEELAARFGTRMVGEVGLQLVGAGSDEGWGASVFSVGTAGRGRCAASTRSVGSEPGAADAAAPPRVGEPGQGRLRAGDAAVGAVAGAGRGGRGGGAGVGAGVDAPPAHGRSRPRPPRPGR